jgi:uncharacterized protein (DUF2132 family)
MTPAPPSPRRDCDFQFYLSNLTLATMPSPVVHPRDPLHGITLEVIVKQLIYKHGWKEMGRRIPIRCFLHDPSVKSSLTFLRKTPWARQKVEGWYIAEHLKK